MSLSMYQVSVPLIGQMLGSLDAILDKAVAHCEAKKIAPEVLLGYRIAPDMHPLTRQVQMVSDQAKGVVARLAGIEVPSFPDDEKTFADLKARIAKTLTFVNSVAADKIDGSEDKEIVLKLGPTFEMKFSGQQYLLHFFMPNFYFHTSTAYNILRHAGVEIGKRDLMGKI
ncbi:MAG: DUF1993 domain-containing protein [Parvibaculum sp.]|nr:DUF1993 domain-containing protein [Parvibaculum sp.]